MKVIGCRGLPKNARSKPPRGTQSEPVAIPSGSWSTMLLPALPVSSCFSLVHVSHFHFGRLFWAVYNCLLVANSHDFLDARGCLASSSEKAVMRQRPSGPWLWLIRVLVMMPQFPLQTLWSHRCYCSCVIFNPLPQCQPRSSPSTVFKSLDMRFKKVKPTLVLSALWGLLPVLVPGCSAQPSQPAQHLAICSVAHQSTDLSWVVL